MSHPLHRWNESFAWRPVSAAPRAIRAEQALAFNERGFFVFEDAFTADELVAVVAEIDPWEAKVTDFLRSRPDGKLFIADAEAITFTTHLVMRSSKLRDFCRSALFTGLAADLIGPDVRLYWDQAVYKKPRSEASFPWHQDNGYTFVEPQQYLTCWVALTDATLDNGCPWIVPGLHPLGTLEHWQTDRGWQCIEDPREAVAVPLRAGSVAVFSSLTPHSTGPNRTDGVRKAYIVQFAPEGAVTVSEAPGGGRVETPQVDPDRQFPLLAGGQPVA